MGICWKVDRIVAVFEYGRRGTGEFDPHMLTGSGGTGSKAGISKAEGPAGTATTLRPKIRYADCQKREAGDDSDWKFSDAEEAGGGPM